MVLKVLEGSFVIEFGGEAMVAKPESYQATSQLASKDDDESSSTPVLGIALGVVFGILAVILIVGVLLLVRKFCLKNHSQPRCIARYVNVYKYGEHKVVLSSKIVIY
jgi:tetrahydromethanopterin S-methyltransferase subunit F